MLFVSKRETAAGRSVVDRPYSTVRCSEAGVLQKLARTSLGSWRNQAPERFH